MSILKAHIAEMRTYQPPLEGRDPHEHLLLDFNERTQPVALHVKQALMDYISSDQLQCYPNYGDIVEKIADYCGVKANQVMITNGSDQGIDLIIRSACNKGDEAIIPAPSFAMYHQIAQVEQLKVTKPAYTREQGFPKQGVLDSITESTRLIVVAAPNNPCGTFIKRQDILDIAGAAPHAAILVDECYFEYTQETVAHDVDVFPNLLVTRTLSKTWGLASFRIGYIISSSNNIAALLNVRGPYDVNQLAVVAARAALSDSGYVTAYVREVLDVSKPMLEAFLDQHHIFYWKSCANFLWMFPEYPRLIEQMLRQHNILVRPKADNRVMGLRVSIGTEEQTNRLLAVLSLALTQSADKLVSGG